MHHLLPVQQLGKWMALPVCRQNSLCASRTIPESALQAGTPRAALKEELLTPSSLGAHEGCRDSSSLHGPPRRGSSPCLWVLLRCTGLWLWVSTPLALSSKCSFTPGVVLWGGSKGTKPQRSGLKKGKSNTSYSLSAAHWPQFGNACFKLWIITNLPRAHLERSPLRHKSREQTRVYI